MDIRHLRYFLAIADMGSFSKAAEKIRVAQPALSQHIRRMELSLGTDLFHRTPHGVELTEAGARLVQHGRQLMEMFDAIPGRVRGAPVEPSGEVRFGVPGTVSQALSARLIREAAARYPKVQLRVAEAMSGFIHDWLRHGSVDVAVLYRGIHGRGINLTNVLSEELRLFGSASAKIGNSKAKSVTFADAVQLPLILPSPGHGLRDQLDEVASVTCGARLSPISEVDSYAPIKLLCEQGYGFSILPAMAIKAECEAGRLRSWKVTEPDLRRSVCIATMADRPMTAASQAIESLCREILRQLVVEGVWQARLLEEG